MITWSSRASSPSSITELRSASDWISSAAASPEAGRTVKYEV
jgi:hypothetical protein